MDLRDLEAGCCGSGDGSPGRWGCSRRLNAAKLLLVRECRDGALPRSEESGRKRRGCRGHGGGGPPGVKEEEGKALERDG